MNRLHVSVNLLFWDATNSSVMFSRGRHKINEIYLC